MSGYRFIVPPLSRGEIRAEAKMVRKIATHLTKSDAPYFDIVRFLDVVLPKFSPNFALEILSTSQMGAAHGLTFPQQHLIQIREDVFRNAQDGKGRDRLTLAHELGHYILHAEPSLARMAASSTIKPYQDSEWQANSFGGELLVSAEHISKCESPHAAVKMFGVSSDAAEYQWRVFKRDGLIS